MKVFVAGHSGMVGSSIIRNAPNNYDIVTANREELDLTDAIKVRDFLKNQSIQVVIMAAARVGGIGANSRFQKEFLVENLSIQNGLMMGAVEAEVQNFVFLGSSCIYPKFASQPIKESSLLTGLLEPTNEGYSLAKIAGIRLARAIYEQDKLNYFSLMPTNLYGPNDNFDQFASHVPAALMRKFHDAKIDQIQNVGVWGSGNAKREFMHTDDLARACWFFVQKKVGGELINIGTGEDITIADFANLMAEIVGYQGNIVFDTSKPDGAPRKLLDVSKAHSYGWKHKIQLEDGLRETYSWFVDALAKGEVRGY